MTRGVDRVACARGPARDLYVGEHLTEKLNKIGRVERTVCGTERCAFCRGHPAIRAERRSIARTRGVPQTALVCGTGSVVRLSGWVWRDAQLFPGARASSPFGGERLATEVRVVRSGRKGAAGRSPSCVERFRPSKLVATAEPRLRMKRRRRLAAAHHGWTRSSRSRIHTQHQRSAVEHAPRRSAARRLSACQHGRIRT